jgi:hypothetical protein
VGTIYHGPIIALARGARSPPVGVWGRLRHPLFFVCLPGTC